MLILTLTLALLAPTTQHAPGEDAAHDHPTAPGTFGAPQPAVIADGEPRLQVVTDRTPSAFGDGFTQRVDVENEGGESARLTQVELLGGMEAALATAGDLRVLTIDDTSVHVGRFATPVSATRGLVIADASGRDALILLLADDARGRITVDRAIDHEHLTLSATLDVEESIAAGDTWSSPGIRCLFADDAISALTALLPHATAGDDDRDPGAAAPAILLAGGTPRWNARGRPLDLFRSNGTCREWLITEQDSAAVALANAARETVFRVLDRDTLGFDGWVRASDEDGHDLGIFRRRLVLPLPPGSRSRIRFAPAEAPPSPPTVVLVTPTDDPSRSTVDRVTADHDALSARVEDTLKRGGAVWWNSRGDVVDPPPPAIADLLVARVYPYRPRSARLPQTAAEERFASRAARVSWELSFPSRRLDEDATWLVSLEAGFYGTPLQPVLADGMPAARGLCVYASPGMVLMTTDLTDAEIDRMVGLIEDYAARIKVLRESGQAGIAVRRSINAGGVFGEMKAERMHALDLVPGDPALLNQWSAALPPRRSVAIRTLATVTGERVTEETLHFEGPFLFATDIPPSQRGDVLFLVRRAPTPSPARYNLLVDNRPVGPPRAVLATEDGGVWRDELFTLPYALFKGRARVAMMIVGDGGPLAIARVGMYLDEPADGRHLAEIPPTRIDEAPELGDTERGLTLDRTIAGDPLRLDGRVSVSGLGMREGTTVEYRLEPGDRWLVGRVGADPATEGGAELIVAVDGVEAFRAGPLAVDAASVAIRVDVRGAQSVSLSATQPAGAGSAGAIQVVDARLIAD